MSEKPNKIHELQSLSYQTGDPAEGLIDHCSTHGLCPDPSHWRLHSVKNVAGKGTKTPSDQCIGCNARDRGKLEILAKRTRRVRARKRRAKVDTVRANEAAKVIVYEENLDVERFNVVAEKYGLDPEPYLYIDPNALTKCMEETEARMAYLQAPESDVIMPQEVAPAPKSQEEVDAMTQRMAELERYAASMITRRPKRKLSQKNFPKRVKVVETVVDKDVDLAAGVDNIDLPVEKEDAMEVDDLSSLSSLDEEGEEELIEGMSAMLQDEEA